MKRPIKNEPKMCLKGRTMPCPRNIKIHRYIDESMPMILMPVAMNTKVQNVAASILSI